MKVTIEKHEWAFDRQETVIDFGKYKGMTYIEIVKENYKYFEWARKKKRPTEKMKNVVNWYGYDNFYH